ncbi:MAG: SIR2 family protein [Planctomycetaceae bacterium]|nr:SIR2 family protein [Planctomycetaceae bacterium]
MEQQLNEIALHLIEKHASVMIGAGFSRNAQCVANSKFQFLSWDELGILFYKRLHGKQPDQNQFFDPMQIAEDLEAVIGRPRLEQLMRQSIPDLQIVPSDLHKRLMELPWNDVFTTNYDTLLERAAETVISQRYDIVVNQEDLVFSTRPRIIKLHGSFPSQRPFIITEEDYRRYPIDFAPFINTVQQSLIENTLCLIGFSGRDPNFLKWIGWIRDNFGNDTSLIYMIVYEENFSLADQSRFLKRNIVPVNLAPFAGNSLFIEKAFSEFFDYLKDEIDKKDPFSWHNRD